MNSVLKKFKKVKNGQDFKELIVQMMLFKTCNNSCDFCFQQNCRSEMPTIEFFKENVEIFCNAVDICFADYQNYDKIKIGIAGGEPLYDKSTIPALLKVLHAVAKYPVEIGVVTNLLYEDLSPAKDVISAMLETGRKFKLYTSFDFGPLRFDTAEKLEKYVENIFQLREHFSSKIGEMFDIRVDAIRTKYMISSLKANDNYAKHFTSLVNSFNVTVNELTGEFDYALSYDQSVQLWKMLFDRYPTLVKNQFSAIHSSRNCFNTACRTIIADQIYEGCLTTHGKLHCGDDQTVKKEMLDWSISQYNCLACEFFSSCPMACLVERRFSKCDMLEVFRYMQMKGAL